MITANALTPEQEASLSLVEREARNAFGSVSNALAVRKAHPSYGYTKAGMRADLDRAIGLAQACAILAGVGTTESAGTAYAGAMGIDVAALAARIKAS